MRLCVLKKKKKSRDVCKHTNRCIWVHRHCSGKVHNTCGIQVCFYCLCIHRIFFHENIHNVLTECRASAGVKNPPANTGDRRHEGSIPGSGRSPGEGNGNQLQYSCLENFMDRGAWWATVHGVTRSWTHLSDWECMHALTFISNKFSSFYLIFSDKPWKHL